MFLATFTKVSHKHYRMNLGNWAVCTMHTRTAFSRSIRLAQNRDFDDTEIIYKQKINHAIKFLPMCRNVTVIPQAPVLYNFVSEHIGFA